MQEEAADLVFSGPENPACGVDPRAALACKIIDVKLTQ